MRRIQQQFNLAGLAENPSQPVNQKRQSATQKRPGLQELQRLLCEDKRRPSIRKGGRAWITCAGILKAGWSVWHRKEKEFVPNAGDKHLMIVALYSQGYGPQRIEEMTGVKKTVCRHVIQGFGLDTPERIAANRKKAAKECLHLQVKEGLAKEERDIYWKAAMKEVRSHKRQQAKYEGLYVDHSEWGRIQSLRNYYRDHEKSKRRSAKNARQNWRKRRNDGAYRMVKSLRHKLWKFGKGLNYSDKLRRATGCTQGQLKAHIESLFVEGMSWDNYGEWHIDHIKPCAAFDLSNELEFNKCFHYSNLQPLWAFDNISKGSLYKGRRHRHKKPSHPPAGVIN